MGDERVYLSPHPIGWRDGAWLVRRPCNARNFVLGLFGICMCLLLVRALILTDGQQAIHWGEPSFVACVQCPAWFPGYESRVSRTEFSLGLRGAYVAKNRNTSEYVPSDASINGTMVYRCFFRQLVVHWEKKMSRRPNNKKRIYTVFCPGIVFSIKQPTCPNSGN